MRVKEIDYPNKLIEAMMSGRLVVFAGAGVSMEAPTALPSFNKLTNEIVRGTGWYFRQKAAPAEQMANYDHYQYFSKRNEGPDEFLGRIQKATKLNVKKRAAEAIAIRRHNGANGFHQAIWSLFRDPNAAKIVTTNYDHFIEIAKPQALKEDFKSYSAPLLPTVDDFTGIVHLHGDVDDPGHIILTDADFAQAYMLNGYAARFMSDLLEKYTVLFIGYSYNDTIVRYLTSEISKKERSASYILTDRRDDIDWRSLGLEPIYFKRTYGDRRDYVKEQESLTALGGLVTTSLAAAKRKIKLFAAAGPARLDLEESDELRFYLTYFPFMETFASHAQSPAWLKWLNENGFLNDLFSDKKQIYKEIKNGLLHQWILAGIKQGAISQREFEALVAQHERKIDSYLLEGVLETLAGDDRYTGWFIAYAQKYRHRLSGKMAAMAAQSLVSLGQIELGLDIFVSYLEDLRIANGVVASKELPLARFVINDRVRAAIAKDPVDLLEYGSRRISQLADHYGSLWDFAEAIAPPASGAVNLKDFLIFLVLTAFHDQDQVSPNISAYWLNRACKLPSQAILHRLGEVLQGGSGAALAPKVLEPKPDQPAQEARPADRGLMAKLDQGSLDELAQRLAKDQPPYELTKLALEQIQAFQQADQEFTRAALLPRLQTGCLAQRAKAWEGILASGAKVLNSQTMLPYYRAAVKRQMLCSPRFFEAYAQNLLHVCPADLLEVDVPAMFNAVDEAGRPLMARGAFCEQISHCLQEQPPRQNDQLWDLWLASYWLNRNDNVFGPLSEDEVKAMLLWPCYLSQRRYCVAVDCALGMQLGQNALKHVYFAILAASPVAFKQPEKTLKFLLFMLQHANRFDSKAIKKELALILRQLDLKSLDPRAIERVKEACLRLEIDLEEMVQETGHDS